MKFSESAVIVESPLNSLANSKEVGLRAIIRRACDPEPQNRYRCVSDMRRALEDLQMPAPKPRSRTPLLAALAVAATIVVAATVLAFLPKRQSQECVPEEIVAKKDAETIDENRSIGGVIAPKEFRIGSINLRRYSPIGPKTFQQAGVIGSTLFEARLNDHVRIEVSLSEPGYCYLLAFRPDGVVDLCLPLNENEPPTKSDKHVYHPTEHNTSYSLDEGAGLWAFAAVASSTPLPPYDSWQAKRPKAAFWTPTKALPGTVWYHDGAWFEKRTAAGADRSRGKDAKLEGPEQSIHAIFDGLRGPNQDASVKVAVIGFAVTDVKEKK